MILSDERVKENIRDFDVLLMPLRYRRFNYKGDNEERVGLIAQELGHIASEFVVAGEGGRLRINNVDLVFAKLAELEWRLKRLEESFVVKM